MGANLKEVRERMTSIKSTMQITKAMKMVSAAKLRRAQQAIVQMRPYSNKQNEMLTNIVSNLDGDIEITYALERPETNVLIVVVTSNRGLCGAFNSFVSKEAVKLVEEKYAAQHASGNLSLMFIGKKGYDYFRTRFEGLNYINDHSNLFADLTFGSTAAIASKIMKQFEDKEYDKVEVVYGEFKNAAVQYFKAEQFLPIQKIATEEGGADDSKNSLFKFEPSAAELLKHMVPSILKTQFHKFMLDTHASEHGARMTAMDKATENADDLLKDLKITYNKARQEAITKEISEIVGGVAALEG